MRKFTKPFHGVRDGEIYPTEFAAGDECPPELIAGAESLDALDDESDDTDTDTDGDGDGDDKEAGAGTGDEKAALQAQLKAAGIGYVKQWGVAKLRAALAEGQKG